MNGLSVYLHRHTFTFHTKVLLLSVSKLTFFQENFASTQLCLQVKFKTQPFLYIIKMVKNVNFYFIS